MKAIYLLLFIIAGICHSSSAEDGYHLWLRYNKISDEAVLSGYTQAIKGYKFYGNSPTLNVASTELQEGLEGLLAKNMVIYEEIQPDIIIVATFDNLPHQLQKKFAGNTRGLGKEGYLITRTPVNKGYAYVITGNMDIALLYGVFQFLKILKTGQDISALYVTSTPKINLRVLNHWDNLDRTVERGYAGFSIWDWHKLPGYIEPRYHDYARANASIGINGTVLTNVNANALVLTTHYLEKVKALADVFRSYGIKVYLTARFSAPMEIGGLKTADPLNEEVQGWWKEKVKEIYSYVPDFGGFLVKANSEGQPGPQNYGRSHAEGANILADAVQPFGGVVMWRAFVYSNEEPEDRAKQAYNEFTSLDGKFRKNVLIQVKNGAIDFQPREPFHPLFGAMPETPLMMEFQITQEYLGQATTLAYMGTLFKEVLSADTYAKGKGSTVAKVIDGSLHNYSVTGMAGVANIGTDRNWTGHTFGQSNWYAFGRLAWDPYLSAEEIATEWIKMTFNTKEKVVKLIEDIMMVSRETVVNYMTPLGLHHLMGPNHHYGPGPWVSDMSRADWTSVYYHRADSAGIGFDRSATGSNAIEQYAEPVQEIFGSIEKIPEEYLLWFHHVDWDYKMSSGRTLWEELCYKYSSGVDAVKWMISEWNKLEGEIDEERFTRVQMLLNIQLEEAQWWKNSSLLYFQSFSERPFPDFVEKPDKTLQYYRSLKFPYAPGIKPEW